MHYKKCEICGQKSGRKSNQKRVFMAQFPLDEKRCKEWVKASGNEDLVYVPIEKLHELKYVCGTHFKPKDFNRKRTRLKRCAIPSLHLKREPLPEEIMQDFPLHVATSQVENDPQSSGIKRKCEDYCSQISKEHNYCNSGSGVGHIRKHSREKESSRKEESREIEETSRTEEWQQDVDNDDDATEDIPHQVEVEKGLFSWQQDSAVVPCDDVSDQCLPPSAQEELDVAVSDDELYDSSPPNRASSQSPSLELVAYRCNICSSEIVGFRYACVQCVDFDMCAACETRQAHAAHYMLRIPESRPCSEVEAKLRTIRRALVADGIVLVDGAPSELEIKEEVKDETSQEDPIELESTRPAASEESDHTSPAHSPPHTSPAHSPPHTSLAYSPPHAPQINSPSNTTSTSTVPVLKIKTGNRLITSNATQPQQSQPQTLNVTHSRSILKILSSKPIVKIKKLDNFTVPLIKKIDKDALMRNLLKQNAGKRKVVVFPSTPEHRATDAQQNWKDTNPEGSATVHASSLQVPIPPKRPKIPSPRQTIQEHKK